MALYTTSVDIANRALQLLGARQITTLTDNSRNAVQCNFSYDKLRVAELQAHVWNFAIAYASNLIVAAPVPYENGQTRNQFTLPTDYIRFADQNPRVAGVYRQNTLGGVKYTDYSIEGGSILSSLSSIVTFRYVKNYTLVTGMQPLFCEALAASMALGMCETLTQNPQKYQAAQNHYDQSIQRAQTLNLIEAGGDEPLENETQTARMGMKAPAPQPTPVRAVR